MRLSRLCVAFVLVATLPLVGVATSRTQGAGAGRVLWKHYVVQSPATGKIERFWIGHASDLKPDGTYPVVYFLDGLLGNENEWKKEIDPHLGRFDLIAVCPSVGGATWFMNSPAHEWMRWGDYLTDELRAFVESEFPASPQKGQRGIAGISAGGHGALYHALLRPDLYASIGVLSGALDLPAYAGQVGLDYWIGPRTPDTLPLYAQRSTLRLMAALETPPPFALFLDTADKDGAKPQMDMLRRILDTKHFPYQWHVGRGAHNWAYWSSRAADLLAWHADQFAQNRRLGRYAEDTPAPAGPGLEVLKGYPEVTLSDEALARLRAPFDVESPRMSPDAVQSPRMSPDAVGTNPRDLQPLAVTGLPAAGALIPREGDPDKPIPLKASLTTRGYEPAIHLYRLTLDVSTPTPDAGAVTLATALQNGRGQLLLTIPPVAIPVPAGTAPRDALLHVRLAVELKAPDPLRGGIVAGLQVFGADGQPVGDPIVGKCRPGTAAVERWPLAPHAVAEWKITLAGPDALPHAALRSARLEEEHHPTP